MKRKYLVIREEDSESSPPRIELCISGISDKLEKSGIFSCVNKYVRVSKNRRLECLAV